MGLLYYISYAAILAAFVFITLSLASGLLYVSELIEEHSQIAKSIGQRGLYVVILLHVLLYFFDSLPLAQTAFSIFCHIVYLQNFSSSWPLISLTSPFFLASCLLVLVDHFTWFFYFSKITHETRHRSYRDLPSDSFGFTEIVSFFAICVWLIPLFLFLSLSANDNTLPMSTAEPGTPTSPRFSQVNETRVSLIRSMFSLFSFDIIPRIRPKVHRRSTSEGLIAWWPLGGPQSPTITTSSPILGASPRIISPPQSPVMRYQSMMPPPHSSVMSMMQPDEPDGNTANSVHTFGTLPSKRPPTMVRRQTGSTAGASRRSLM